MLAAAGSVIAAMAVEATFGYATGNPAAYGWTHVTAMAFLTAVTMLILALSLLSAAWRDSRTRYAGLPRWLPMPAGALALGLAVWLVIDGRAVAAGRISAVTFTGRRQCRRAGHGRPGDAGGLAGAAGGRAAPGGRGRCGAAVTEAERAARESEHRLFQFLDAMPVAVFIASPGGQPYYANDEADTRAGPGRRPGRRRR